MRTVPSSRYWCFGFVAIAGVLTDLATKWKVFHDLGGPHRMSDWTYRTDLLWGRFEFSLATTFNHGALFGIGQGLSWLFALLSIGAASGIVYWLFVRGNARSLWLTVTLGLILAGALGNLYDRMALHGWTDNNGAPVHAVRDFLNCTIPGVEIRDFKPRLIREYHWPVFNFADVFLVTGAVMLTLYSFFAPQPSETSESGGIAQPKADAPPAAPSSPAPGAAA
ncbi:MAG: signal peptidase II [Planctomycetes bacterium]|nr:signal peptidase II [Planctomycetota bacterium]